MTEISPEKIKELQDKIRSLPQRIIEAQEYERHRISKEIHDELGQSLATLKMLIQSSVLPEYLETRLNRRAYDRVITYIDEIIEKSRNIATSLRPKVIETMGLTLALKKLILDFRKNKGLNIRAQVGNLDDLEFEERRSTFTGSFRRPWRICSTMQRRPTLRSCSAGENKV